MRECWNWQTGQTKDLVVIAIVWVQVPSPAGLRKVSNPEFIRDWGFFISQDMYFYDIKNHFAHSCGKIMSLCDHTRCSKAAKALMNERFRELIRTCRFVLKKQDNLWSVNARSGMLSLRILGVKRGSYAEK